MRGRFAFVFVGVVACGGGASPGDPLSSVEQTTACQQYCTYRVGCGDDMTACHDWCTGVVGLIRGDAATSLLDCYTQQSCNVSGENACLADTINGTDPTQAYKDTLADCVATQSRCGASYGCDETYYVLLNDGTLAKLSACFAMDCGQVNSCAAGVLGAL
jgi:hypothetical protein